jgi:hypothetical protein
MTANERVAPQLRSPVVAWLADRTRHGPGWTTLRDLHADFREWRRLHEAAAIEREELALELQALGIALGEDDFLEPIALRVELVACPIIHPDIVLWFRDRCRRDPEGRLRWRHLYADYKQWCEEKGRQPVTRRRFESHAHQAGLRDEEDDEFRRVVVGVVFTNASMPSLHSDDPRARRRRHPDGGRPLLFAAWGREFIIRRPGAVVTLAALHASYAAWARDRSLPLSKRDLAQEIARRGVARNRRGFVGLALFAPQNPADMTPEEGLALWLRERCARDEAATTLTADLYSDYRRWASGKGTFVATHQKVGRFLAANGLTPWRLPGTRRERCFIGLRLLAGGVAGAGVGAVGDAPVSAPAPTTTDRAPWRGVGARH